jgi:translin
MTISEQIEQIGEALLKSLESKNAAREQALTDSRTTIRNCAHAVRATHRGDFTAARELLAQAGSQIAATRAALAAQPDIYWTGYVQDAQKEYAEANIILAVVAGDRLPQPAELGVEVVPYMNGLGEAAGEMRRYTLDTIRGGDTARGEVILGVMEEIYSLLVTVDFPDAITGGLRRTTDMVRGVLERTRGDLTFARQQQTLTAALARHLPAGMEVAPAPGFDGQDEE